MSEDCLFCGIAAGQVPAEVVGETERVLAITDINPQAPVHLLVIPREHYRDIGELVGADPRLAAELIEFARVVAGESGLSAAGWRLVFNSGLQAGQTVFHVHGHVLGGRAMHWPPG
ncbi:MAG: histidine triad nucleotide-binding protein [Mycobacteriales bacterium]